MAAGAARRDHNGQPPLGKADWPADRRTRPAAALTAITADREPQRNKRSAAEMNESCLGRMR